MISYAFDTRELQALAAKVGGSQEVVTAELELALVRSAILIQNIAKGESPTRTGKLRNSIQYKVSGLRAVIGPTVGYGLFVEGGTGIYGPNNRAITPKNKQVLATKVNPGFGTTANKGGYFIIGKSSKGQKANPFMERTYASVPAIVTTNFMLARDNIILKKLA